MKSACKSCGARLWHSRCITTYYYVSECLMFPFRVNIRENIMLNPIFFFFFTNPIDLKET